MATGFGAEAVKDLVALGKYDEALALATKLLQRDVGGLGAQALQPRPQVAVPRWNSPVDKLCMRMDWSSLNETGFGFVNVHIASEKAFVFIVTKDAQAVIIEDDPNLFPSDNVVTKIRLLLG